MFNGVEYIRELCKDYQIPISVLEKECKFSNGYLNPKKITKVTYERALVIENFFIRNGISVERNKLLGILEEITGTNSSYENFEKLLEINNLKAADVCRGTGLPSSLFSEWKKGKSTPKADKIQKIADFFGVSFTYLMTGKEDIDEKQNPELTARDERDISKSLDKIMDDIKNSKDGPLYYKGSEIEKEQLEFINSAIEFALRKIKPINKKIYNPHKNDSKDTK